MNHYPIFLSVAGQRIVLAGAGEAAEAKLRLLLKTAARITVFAAQASPAIQDWAAQGRLAWVRRALRAGDARGARLVYAATEDAGEDALVAALAQADGALVNIVDNLADSDFITPAIVDRDPVVVAIGTEGAAPVLARAIKAELEARLPAALGPLARIGKAFRSQAARLAPGRARRNFWADYYMKDGPDAYAEASETGARAALDRLLARHLSATPASGQITVAGIGPDDPELLVHKTRQALDRADLVIHPAAIAPAILDLARREAAFLPETPGSLSAALRQAQNGAEVLWLRPGMGHLPAGLPARAAKAGMRLAHIPGLALPPALPQSWSPAA